MAATSVSIQQFRANVEAAEAASDHGPVFITEDGKPRRVLIDIADYQKLSAERPGCVLAEKQEASARSNSELLAMPDEDYFEWEPPRLEWNIRPVDFD